jgi:hypothetical protein
MISNKIITETPSVDYEDNSIADVDKKKNKTHI